MTGVSYPATSYYFQRLDINSGLSQNCVNAILQDRNGFMWFATRDGLNRYDGTSFKVFRNDFSDVNTLNNNFITSLLEDPAGNIWIGTDVGVCIYYPEEERFEQFSARAVNGRKIEKTVTKIGRGEGDRILIAVEGSGLFEYDPASCVLVNYPLNERYGNIREFAMEEGGTSHRPNTVELWDDTVYMLGMFFIEMYRQTGDEKYIRELMGQYYAHAEVLADPGTGLWYHGWDADEVDFDDNCGQVRWADKVTRRSNEMWGRGNGWIFMILADVLEVIPQNSPMRKEVARELSKMSKILPKLQDKKTGMRYQLPVRYGEEGDFLESSCTAMFSYALAIGVKHGVLKKKTFQPVVDRAYYGLREYAMLDKGDGYISPDKVCIGTCIGDKDYYFNRKVASGIDFAVGVFVMFGLEYERQHELRPN